MFDAIIRPAIDGPLDAAGRRLASWGAKADYISIAGLALGLAAALAIACGAFVLGLALFMLNRFADGLDGAVARHTALTDRGGFLDITLDFFVYAAIPLAFAINDPLRNALPAASLLASFLMNGSAFLAFSALAARRGMRSRAQGLKSIYYLAGIAEGTETIVFFVAFCIIPGAFPQLAFAFAAICTISAAARLMLGWKALGARISDEESPAETSRVP
jgi:phosphatidylglycerophosphate synthase